jgi:hypothetical protein
MAGIKEIVEALEVLARLIANHPKNGEAFNYEDFAKEKVKKLGRGYIWIDSSQIIAPYLKGENRECEFFNRYIPSTEDQGDFDGVIPLLENYDPACQYVVALSVDCEKLPTGLISDVPNRYVVSFFTFDFYKKPKPSHITPNQIRKRLNRMMTEGIRLLILDTSKPDFMGKNLEKWLREVKTLQRQGKYISVMIDSEDDQPYRGLPDDLKADILPMRLG